MSKVSDFRTNIYSDPKLFTIAKDAAQYEKLKLHIDEVLKIHHDYIVTHFGVDLSSLMTLENNAGWDSDEKHEKKMDLIRKISNEYQPNTDRFLS